MSAHYAHAIPDRPAEEWRRLGAHLGSVARVAAKFAAAFGAARWGYVAGVLHDAGKYSGTFQRYLRGTAEPDAHIAEAAGRVDHSTAGAQHAVEKLDIAGHLLAYVVAGHHTGLLDGRSDGPCLEARLQKKIERVDLRALQRIEADGLPFPDYLRDGLDRHDAFAAAFFVRMLFSCLTDADFLDTEEFLHPELSSHRPAFPPDVLELMKRSCNDYLFRLASDDSPINGHRREVRIACERAARLAPGFFSLTVPTGCGKTLSSLAFALNHAVAYNLSRVVYVAPFTSTIEQNADVFRNALRKASKAAGEEVVLEHHSNFDPVRETIHGRLASENWDAPLIVTTAVQFYESLFANRSSRCRKLHNLTKSVIVLDEAQTLPVSCLAPCLRALREIVRGFGATVVLCTATQPAIRKRSEFPIGLASVREIIPAPRELYRRQERTKVRFAGVMSDEEIVDRLKRHEQVLCVVNTRSHAKALFDRLGGADGCFHLSTLMCPEHRTQRIGCIKRRLADGKPCRVVSTQLIEAGVDVDFPIVFRLLAGIDSIAQAAGRCNRNGKLPGKGKVVVFRSEHTSPERFFTDTANCTAQLVELYPDLLSLDAVEHYFRLYYWDRKARWDERSILDGFRMNQDPRLPFLFDFAAISEQFRLIAETGAPVIVPWGKSGEELVRRLKGSKSMADPQLTRALQRYTVTIPQSVRRQQVPEAIELVLDQYPVLLSPETHYSEHTGLGFDDPADVSIL